MSGDLVSQTAQGAVLSMTSNILAQVISSYKYNTPLSIDLAPIIKFTIFAIISCPPNVWWQTFLEQQFPTNVRAPMPKSEYADGKMIPTKMSKTNVLIKLILDQTIGAALNTIMFLVFMGYVNAPAARGIGKAGSWEAATQEVSDKFWPITKDGYKVWPFYSLVSFLFIPVNKRVVAGSLVGVGWNIYLSLMVGS